jgi:hypothetical protein
MIAEIRHPYPGMHRQGIARRRQTILAKDFVRIGLTAIEFVGIITRNAILHCILLLMRFGGRLRALGERGSRQEKTGE